MRVHAPGKPLALDEVPVPQPGPGQVLVKVLACGVCRTDLHVADGDLTDCEYPVTPGHEIVGRVEQGGRVVCGGIHMSDIPQFPYALRWGERRVQSVANLTRRDGEEFLDLAARAPIRTEVKTYPLERANAALDDLRAGRFEGAAVLVP